MNRVLLIGLILLGCCWPGYGQSNLPERARPYSPAAKSVVDSINQWERATNVKVYSDARSQIADDAGRLDVSHVFIPKERYEESLAWTKDVLVKTYLYAIWARKRAQVFITKAQVQAYRLGQYVQEHLRILGDPFGNIEFISVPVGATIKIDNREEGMTPMGFVVSGEPRDCAIVSSQNKLDCRRTIQVPPGTSRTMTCPPATR
jgi:hypothetical protein